MLGDLFGSEVLEEDGGCCLADLGVVVAEAED